MKERGRVWLPEDFHSLVLLSSLLDNLSIDAPVMDVDTPEINTPTRSLHVEPQLHQNVLNWPTRVKNDLPNKPRLPALPTTNFSYFMY